MTREEAIKVLKELLDNENAQWFQSAIEFDGWHFDGDEYQIRYREAIEALI